MYIAPWKKLALSLGSASACPLKSLRRVFLPSASGMGASLLIDFDNYAASY